MDAEPFIRVSRWYLGLSQPAYVNAPLGSHNGAPPEHALCAAYTIHPDEVVDLNGFHTAACPSSFRARKDDCHDKIRDVLADAVERAGGIANREPVTKRGVAMLNQIDSSILRVAFPKSYSAASRLVSNKILTLIGQMNGTSASRRRHITDQVLQIANLTNTKLKGRTMDVLTTFPVSNRAMSETSGSMCV